MKNVDNIILNFKDSIKSNSECIFINPYAENLHLNLRQELKHYQVHSSLSDFLNSDLSEPFQFIDLSDIQTINETTSVLLFEKVRGKAKLIIYDTKKPVSEDLFKFCNWLRMYTMN